MQTQSHGNWWLRIATFLVAALAAASAMYWALKLSAPTPQGPKIPVLFAAPSPTDPQGVARLLGGGKTAATPEAAKNNTASRFKLTGVVADRTQGGYALIAIDGKAAKPYRVGTQVAEQLVLKSVALRSATLAPSAEAPASLTLELPKLGAN